MQQTITTLILTTLVFTHPVNSLESKMRGMARHSLRSDAEVDMKSEKVQALVVNAEDATNLGLVGTKQSSLPCGGSGYFTFNPDESSRSYSSVYTNAPAGTTYARSMLDSEQAWSSAAANVGEFMVFDLGEPASLTGVVIQNRKDKSWEYVKTFTVSYSNDGKSWSNLQGTYNGVTPHAHNVEAIFASPISARHVKLVVQSWATWISMRAGLLVCTPCKSIVSNPPDASRTYSGVYMSDASGTGHARSMLDSPQAWSPWPQTNQYVIMDLGAESWVSGVVSQARQDKPFEYVKSFAVETSLDGKSYAARPGLYMGSTSFGKYQAKFPTKIKARYVKMIPKAWQIWPSSRVGVLVCETTTTTTTTPTTTTPTTTPTTTTPTTTTPTTTTTTKTTTIPAVPCDGWKLVGCKARRPNTVFPSLKEANMSREVCLQFCKAGYAESTSFGLEGGDTCYCFPYEFEAFSSSPGVSDCNIPCAGNSKQMCGGQDVSLMYKIDDCQSDVVVCRNGSGIPEVTGANIYYSDAYAKHMSCANLQTTVGNNVNNKYCDVQCIEGFKLTRNDIVCELEEIEGSTEPYAVWRGDAECEPYDCGEPDCVAHSTNEEGAVSFPNRVKYMCTLGYTTDGTPTGNTSFFRQCLSSGELEEPQACMPIVCGAAPEDPNGIKTSPYQVYNFERDATYMCNEGYSVDGDADGKKTYLKKCLAGGKFSNLWSCLPVSCGPAKTYANATLAEKPMYVLYPNDLTYRCEAGFSVDIRPQTANNSFFVSSCTSSGKYSVQESPCKRISCGSPKQTNHSTFESDEFLFFTDTIVYTCDKGYTTDGQPKGSDNAVFSEECGPDGQFLQQSKACLPVQCPNLPVVPNASLVTNCAGSTCVYLDEPLYTCNPGFSTFPGDDPRNRSNEKFTLQCLANGQFEAPPTCVNIDNCLYPFLKTPGDFGTCHDNDVPTGKPDLDYTTVCLSGYEVTERSTAFEGSPMSDDICTNINDCPPRDSFAFECGGHQWAESGACVDAVNMYSCNCSEGFEVVMLKGSNNSNQTCIPKTCGEVPTVADATFVHPPFAKLLGYINETTTLLTPNHMIMFEPPVKYACDDGFTLNGNASGINTFNMACVTNNGVVTMSDAPPCLPVTCGPPYNISNAKPGTVIPELFYSKTFENRSLWHACDAGYTNDTVQYAFVPGAGVYEECLANGSKGPKLSCVPMDCGVPPAIAFATVKSNKSVRFGDEVEYVCLEGYSTDGSIDSQAAKGLITCAPDAKLTGITPCQPIKCGYLPPTNETNKYYVTPFAEHEFLHFVYSQVAKYKTLIGYTLGGEPDGAKSFEVTCNHTGPPSLTEGLNSFLPHVKPVKCGAAPYVPNSQYDNSGKVFMNVVVYTCDQGYSVNGEPAGSNNSQFSITCEANGNFTPVSECKPVVCDTHPQPDHSIKVSTASVFVFEDEMSFKCKPGYSLNGLMNGTTGFNVPCLYDGTFAKPAECMNIDNCLYSNCTGYGTCQDNAEPTGNHVDDHKCVCEPGFKEVVTSSYRTCVNINDCPVGACEPGTCQDLILGYKCLCPMGYYNDTNTKEKWPQDCFRQSCGSPPPEKYSDVSDAEVLFEGTVTYTCKTGYTLTSKPDDVATFTISCMAGSVFSKAGHFGLHNNSCEPVFCGQPPLSENLDDEGVSKKDSVVFPEVVTYTCETGYTTDGTCTGAGNYSRTCAASGNFDYVAGVEKKCLPVLVGTPTLPNAIYEGTVMHYPDTRAVTCETGYSLEPKIPAHKNFTLKTKPDCTWQAHGTCSKVSCGTPASKPFTTLSVSGATVQPNFGMSVGDMAPNFGMQPRGGPPLAPPLPDPKQGTQAGVELVYQEEATYTTVTGYSFNGKADGPKTCSVECLATGAFSECKAAKPVQCSLPPVPDNAHIMIPQVSPLTYKMKITFICHPGYTTDAKPVRGPDNGMFKVTCQADGTFSPPAQCVPVECGKPPDFPHSKFIMPVPKTRFPRKTSGGFPKYGSHPIQRKTSGSPSKSGGSPYMLRFLQSATTADEALQLVIDSTQKLYYKCDPGYSLNGFLLGRTKFEIQCQHDGKFSVPPYTCTNIDDCEGNRCSPNGKCKDNAKPTGNHSIDYTCICDYGHYVKWEKPPWGLPYQTCANPDDCPPSACGTAGYCKDLLNDYKCICPLGYYEGMNGSVKDCLPKSCGVPVTRPFASPATTAEQFYPQEVEYNCSAGYSLDGAADGDYTYTAICNVSKDNKVGFVFDGNCQPVKCADPAPAGNAKKDMNSLEFPQNVSYTCNQGFALDGTCTGLKKFSMTCNAGGHIVDVDGSAAVPDCLPVSAGNCSASVLPNALFDDAEMFFGDSQNVTCKPGYSTNEANKALNTFLVTATSDCKLTIPFTCVPLKCGAAPIVANTNMSNMATDIVFPTKVTYTTVTGYTLDGAANGPTTFSTSCNVDGVFDSVVDYVPKRIGCGNPKKVDNAKPPAEVALKYMDVAKYTCKEGYSIDGEPVLSSKTNEGFQVTCLASGEISPTKQCLPVKCAEIPDPDRSEKMTKSTSFVYKDVLQFKCLPGWSINGVLGGQQNFTTTCQADGKFSATESCSNMNDCIKVPNVDGVCVDHKEPIGVHIDDYHMDCDSGFEEKISNENVRVCVNIENCTKSACHPGSCVDKTNDFQCVCPLGWVGTGEHECKRKSCGTPAAIPNAGNAAPEMFFMDTFEYACKPGYTKSGTATKGLSKFNVSCEANGEVIGMKECLPVECNLMTIDNAVLKGESPTVKREAPTITMMQNDAEATPLYTKYANHFVKWGKCGQTGREGNCGDASVPEDTCVAMGKKACNDNPQCSAFAVRKRAKDSYGSSYIMWNGAACVSEHKYSESGGYWDLYEKQASTTPPHQVDPLPYIPIPSKGGKTTFPNIVEYICQGGYSTGGTCDTTSRSKFQMQCTEDGSMRLVDSAHSKCLANTAGSLNTTDLPFSSFVPGGEVKYPDIVKVDCQPGYSTIAADKTKTTFEVKSTQTCGFEPHERCGPINCDALPARANSKYGKDKIKYGEVITYQCDTGYSFDAQPWKGSVCERPYCTTSCDPYLYCLEPGKFNDACFKAPQDCLLRCAGCFGMNFVNNLGYVACRANGTVVVPFTCSAVECGVPGSVANAVASSSNMLTFVDNTVKYKCVSGFSLDGKAGGPTEFTVTCQASGAQVGFKKCQPVECATPDSRRNSVAATRGSHLIVFKDKVTFTCSKGFSIDGKVGSATQYLETCQSTGLITDSTSCKDIDYCVTGPGHCGGGSDSLCLDGLLDYTCNCSAGYEAKQAADDTGLVRLMCVEVNECVDPNFKGDMTCAPYGTCVDKFNSFICNCSEGYKAVDMRGLPNGRQRCEPVECGALPSVAFAARPAVRKLVYPQNVTYQCDDGYSLNAEATGPTSFTVACQSNKKLTPVQACLAVKCPSILPVVKYATTSFSGQLAYTSGLANYTCEEGYTTTGQAEGSKTVSIQCNSNGDFEYTTVQKCKKVTCGLALDVEFSEYADGEKFFGATTTYKCDPGYSVDGDAKGATEFTITCKSSGNFTEASACNPVSCGLPANYANAKLDIVEKVYKEKIEVSCDTGYSVTGVYGDDTKFLIKCGADGSYATVGKYSECVPISCGVPLPKVFSKPTATVQVRFNESAEWKCNDIASVDGSPSGDKSFTLSCEANGKFSQANPVDCMDIDYCHPGPCGTHGTCFDCSTVDCSSGPPKNAKFVKVYTNPYSNSATAWRTPIGPPPVGGGNPFMPTGSGGNPFMPPGFGGTNFLEVGGPMWDSNKDYGCLCQNGYETKLNKEGKLTCSEDDCANSKCGDGGSCVDLSTLGGKENAYKCNCRRGYVENTTSDGFATCTPVQCPAKSVPNAELMRHIKRLQGAARVGLGDAVIAWDALMYKCDKGYSTDGGVSPSAKSLYTQCSQIGKLTHMRKCQKIKCDAQQVMPVATSVGVKWKDDGELKPIGSSYSYGDSLTFECEYGYHVSKSTNSFDIQCLETSKFSKAESCKPVSCGKPQEKIKKINVSPSITTEVHFGKHVTMTCDYGHRTVFNAKKYVVHCKADQAFTQSYSCIKVKCANGLKFGESKKTMCPPGYKTDSGLDYVVETCKGDKTITKSGVCKQFGFPVSGIVTDAVSEQKFLPGAKITFTKQPQSTKPCMELGWFPFGTNKFCASNNCQLSTKSYQDAEAECTAKGARLCTSKELPSLDFGFCGKSAQSEVWTSTPCPNGYYAYKAPISPQPPNVQEPSLHCVAAATANVVHAGRCCADTFGHTGGAAQPITTYAGSNGKYSVNLMEGSYYVQGTQPKYIDALVGLTVDKPIKNGPADIALSPVMQNDQIRIVMDWADVSTDLDSWTTFGPHTYCHPTQGCQGPCDLGWWLNPRIQQCGSMMGEPIKATLDRDDVDGWGPETTTLDGIGKCAYDWTEQCMIVFSVWNYTPNSERLKKSNALITIYRGSQQVDKFYIAPMMKDLPDGQLYLPVVTINSKTGDIYRGYAADKVWAKWHQHLLSTYR